MDFSALKKNIIFIILKVVLPILLAGFIYLFYRSTETVIFKIINTVISSDALIRLRLFFQFNFSLTSVLIYSLPGGLWLYSFSNLVLIFFNKNEKTQYVLTLLILFFIVCTLELFQYLQITDGTFDLIDLLFYSFAILLSFITGKKSINKNQYYIISKVERSPFVLLSGIVICFTAGIYLADVLTH